MTQKVQKMVVVPLDGSPAALKTLDYLVLFFGPDHPLEIRLLHVQPPLPASLVEESCRSVDAARQLKEMGNRYRRMADKFLEQGRKRLIRAGFDDRRVSVESPKNRIGVARDICAFSEKGQADAVVLGTRGRSRLEAFLLGETANKVLDASRVCPVWLVKGEVSLKTVLIAVDGSENAMKAVDHAGFMLSGTDVDVRLFHAKRGLRAFFPQSVVEGSQGLEELWSTAAGKEIAPHMEAARDMLVRAGLPEGNIAVQVVKGSRNTAADLLKAARTGRCGTVVMGRRGLTGVQAYTMGSVSRKVIENCRDTALWLTS